MFSADKTQKKEHTNRNASVLPYYSMRGESATWITIPSSYFDERTVKSRSSN